MLSASAPKVRPCSVYSPPPPWILCGHEAETGVGEMLASAGDDGNVLLWVPSETQTQPGFGQETLDDKETWRVKHMCRSSGAEIYDLAWSPDGVFIITGSMDNIARIYNAQTGTGYLHISLLFGEGARF